MDMTIINTDELKNEVAEQIGLPETRLGEVKKLAEQNANDVMTINPDNIDERRQAIKSIDDFAIEVLANSARKNALLQATIGHLSKSGEEGGAVSNSLADLHREIKGLDPSLLDFTRESFLDKIFNPVKRYFEKYAKADSVINDILLSLDKGKATLKNDNTTLDLEEDAMRDLAKKLNEELALGIAMDEMISERIERAQADGEDESKIRFATEEIQFPLRQRVMDLQQMAVVNQQGIIAMEVVKRNNKELMRGVDRAKTVTVTALRTAVMVASALYNQKIVLRKIELLNEATSNVIASTSRMLKDQGAAIQKQATQSTISPDALKQAFQDTLSALEDISTFKRQALPRMQETVKQFRQLAQTGEQEIARLTGTQEKNLLSGEDA